MAVSRDEVFGVLQGVIPHLEEALPGWSVRPNITGTGAVGLYLDGPDLPLAGVTVEGKPVARHLCGTIQTADRGLPQELGQVRYQYILGVSVAEHKSEYPESADLASVGEPNWVPALRALEVLVESEGREALFISRGGYVPGRRALGKRRVALRREFFPGKPWLGLGTIDWCAGVRSTPVYAEDLAALVAAATRLASSWDAALRTGAADSQK
ncbi:L-alanine-DL-glutamate epimerase [Rothia mucilaginosa]|uniref:L-alanine-DL-glutamate epimerase n=1 Tax=Rothia mucilaginosa TaxID=43675 RepID=UPI0028E1D654|nr:L-alanine-DL-glutamate epimerase [Rothia mucilaginosa]